MEEKMKIVLDKLKEKWGNVSVFAIMKMDDFVDKWSVILSVPAVTAENRTEVFEFVRKLLIEELDPKDVRAIAQIGLLQKDDHLIQQLLQYQTGATIEDKKLNGNMIHKALILASDRTV